MGTAVSYQFNFQWVNENLKRPSSIGKSHGEVFCILNKNDKNLSFEVVINSPLRIYKCKILKSFSVCQLTLAVLDQINLPYTFLEKSKCAKSVVAISKLANVGTEANTGSKKRNATAKWKEPFSHCKLWYTTNPIIKHQDKTVKRLCKIIPQKMWHIQLWLIKTWFRF